MAAPIITLTTDFGTRDSYVAQVKGVLLRLGPPGLQLVDLSHEIGAQDVRAAAFFLREAVPRFPAGTIHLAVIDPGVGSARRAVVAQAGTQRLVGPDNGVFGWLLGDDADVHEIAQRGAGAPLSSTFHGRDVFAPAAAQLACGTSVGAFGPAVLDAERLAWPEPVARPHGFRGQVVHCDRFGNLITNLPATLSVGENPQVELQGRRVGPLRDHYAQVPPRELLALVGSAGLIEVAVRDGDAAALTGAGVGAAVDLVRGGQPASESAEPNGST